MTLKLFCLPFAGGSKYSFNDLVKHTPAHLEIIPIDYPGRGARLGQSLLTNMQDLIEDVYRQVEHHIHAPYAVFGHSMGALVSYLLTRKISTQGLALPAHLFVSGRSAPSVAINEPVKHSMPKAEFKNMLTEMGGIPLEILENESSLSFFEAILRADFKAVEDYKYEPLLHPLNIPITVMSGAGEDITDEALLAWQKETAFDVHSHRFPGRHFFIYDHPAEIMKLIAARLTVCGTNGGPVKFA